ncbi:MAG: M14 family zinc carboxypeptidase [Victivallaceae bacterium]
MKTIQRAAALAGMALLLGACAAPNRGESEVKNPRFAPLKIAGLAGRPSWWQVRPAEITEACRNVKRGRAEVIATAPLGYPVYALFYGECPPAAGTANWSAGSASDDPDAYLGKAPRKQTVVWVSGFHGAEAEGVAAAMNLIHLLETGRDLRGKSRDSLLELVKNYNLIIIPCLNMDGRSISPDHLNGVTKDEFLNASQGSWRDGRMIGWRGSKAHFPLPLDQVAYPGGYPNSEGFNPMHDAEPGNIRTAEVRGLLNLVGKYGVDLLINFHSYSFDPAILPPGEERALFLYEAINRALYEAKFRKEPVNPKPQLSSAVNFNTLIPLTSGGMAITLECPVAQNFSFDDFVDINLLTLEAALKTGTERPFFDRQANFNP